MPDIEAVIDQILDYIDDATDPKKLSLTAAIEVWEGVINRVRANIQAGESDLELGR